VEMHGPKLLGMWRGFAFCCLNTELLTGPAVVTRWHTERYANKENMETKIDWRDFRLPPRSRWELCSAGLQRSD